MIGARFAAWLGVPPVGGDGFTTTPSYIASGTPVSLASAVNPAYGTNASGDLFLMDVYARLSPSGGNVTSIPAPAVIGSKGAAVLGVALIGRGDDAGTRVSYTGESGGDWTQAYNNNTTTGVDSSVSLQTVALAIDGSISGGSQTDGINELCLVAGMALHGTGSTSPSYIATGTGVALFTAQDPAYGTNNSGDRFLMMVYCRHGGTFTPPTAPSGWTQQVAFSSSNNAIYIFTRDAASTGSESGNVTIPSVSSTGGQAVIHTFRDWTGTISSRSTTDGVLVPPGPPSGWTLRAQGAASNNMRWVFTRNSRSTGSESGNVTIPNISVSGGQAVIHTFRNVATSNFLESITSYGTVSANSSTIDAPTVAAEASHRLAVALVGRGDDAGTRVSFTGESGGDWTQVYDSNSSAGEDSGQSLQTAALDSGGTISGGSQSDGISELYHVTGFALVGL